MAARRPLAVLFGTLTLTALVVASTTASAGGSCASEAGSDGYSYAGYGASHSWHGVRATISATRAPGVEAGHVAGWVGVGGPGQGANGEDAWIQAGIASMPGRDPFLYAEITREGRRPELIRLAEGVAVGESHAIAVLEVAGRPDWWLVRVDGAVVAGPVSLPGSSGRWAPIATAESWTADTSSCNSFRFRFERVSVSHAGGWRPFVPAQRFLDASNRLRDLPKHAFVAAST